MGTESQICKLKCSGDLFRNSMNIFDTTELYTLKMIKKLNFVLFITIN